MTECSHQSYISNKDNYDFYFLILHYSCTYLNFTLDFPIYGLDVIIRVVVLSLIKSKYVLTVLS